MIEVLKEREKTNLEQKRRPVERIDQYNQSFPLPDLLLSEAKLFLTFILDVCLLNSLCRIK